MLLRSDKIWLRCRKFKTTCIYGEEGSK